MHDAVKGLGDTLEQRAASTSYSKNCGSSLPNEPDRRLSQSLSDMTLPTMSKRRRHALLLIAAAVSGLSCRATVQGQVRRLARKNPQVLYYVDTEAKAVALTIDDGPDPVTTPEILDVLRRNEAHATFFIISSRVPGNEAWLRRMVAEDHELGNHMLRDEPSIKLSPEEFERQLLESHEVLSAFARVYWFRPGSGKYNPRMLATLERHGYKCALGSVYPFDPQVRWSWFSRRFILSTVQAGSIVILHDWGSKGRRTVKTLSKVLPALRERGLRVVTLTELEGLGAQRGLTRLPVNVRVPRSSICSDERPTSTSKLPGSARHCLASTPQ